MPRSKVYRSKWGCYIPDIICILLAPHVPVGDTRHPSRSLKQSKCSSTSTPGTGDMATKAKDNNRKRKMKVIQDASHGNMTPAQQPPMSSCRAHCRPPSQHHPVTTTTTMPGRGPQIPWLHSSAKRKTEVSYSQTGPNARWRRVVAAKTNQTPLFPLPDSASCGRGWLDSKLMHANCVLRHRVVTRGRQAEG